MTKSNSKASVKALRREKALKKEKQKKLLITVVFVVALAAVLSFAIYSSVRQSSAETFSDAANLQTVYLYKDGKFQANLHGKAIKGSYIKTEEGGKTNVSFNEKGEKTAVGWIENDILRLPAEWDDGHNHAKDLPKK
ncbi:MAG: hypothetical protein FWE85_05750 [Clostridiales bacterium]|nr:hypothetical protein [Clostridiales bacterium]